MALISAVLMTRYERVRYQSFRTLFMGLKSLDKPKNPLYTALSDGLNLTTPK